MAEQHEIDPVTGQKTTGHEWDGIKELDTPLPRWWVITFLGCIVFSLVYMVLMPAIPSLHDYTKGLLGWTSHKSLARAQEQAMAGQKGLLDAVHGQSVVDIARNPDLDSFAIAGGEALFRENCMACHGQGGSGRAGGYPVLADNDWLWGGKLEDIQKTITYGVRIHEEGRSSAMPQFGADGTLNSGDIHHVGLYVRTLSGLKADGTEHEIAEGQKIFAENCVACHGDKGQGNRDVGAPALNDAIWLYGSTQDAIEHQVYNPRMGAMPAWVTRLSPDQIKMLTLYVHQLGGGE